jgi:L-iditol 2-dehydrogenase
MPTGSSVVVVGLGVTGLLHVQLAKLGGARVVIGLGRNQAKLKLAGTLGADLTLHAEDPSTAEAVRDATGGGADLVIECVGTIATLGGAVRMARAGGGILAYGTIPETFGDFPFYELYYKELIVTGARAARDEDFPVAIDHVASGRVLASPLVADRIPLSAVASAMQRVDRGLKVIVEL